MKKRLDVLLVERGLATSRHRAQALIMTGNVLVDDVPVTKSGQTISEESRIRLRAQDHPYVSRAALKLLGALDSFPIVVSDRVALDVGASTGGFTQVLLERGVARVFAVDVGHNQMDWKIRTDPRVTLFEKTNARSLEWELIGEQVDLIVMDVSFISIVKILPALIPFQKSGETDWVTLIKPQFEVGREKVGAGGIVANDEDRQHAVAKVTEYASGLGLCRHGLIESPIAGTDGNRELLAWWKSGR